MASARRLGTTASDAAIHPGIAAIINRMRLTGLRDGPYELVEYNGQPTWHPVETVAKALFPDPPPRQASKPLFDDDGVDDARASAALNAREKAAARASSAPLPPPGGRP